MTPKPKEKLNVEVNPNSLNYVYINIAFPHTNVDFGRREATLLKRKLIVILQDLSSQKFLQMRQKI